MRIPNNHVFTSCLILFVLILATFALLSVTKVPTKAQQSMVRRQGSKFSSKLLCDEAWVVSSVQEMLCGWLASCVLEEPCAGLLSVSLQFVSSHVLWEIWLVGGNRQVIQLRKTSDGDGKNRDTGYNFLHYGPFFFFAVMSEGVSAYKASSLTVVKTEWVIPLSVPKFHLGMQCRVTRCSAASCCTICSKFLYTMLRSSWVWPITDQHCSFPCLFGPVFM